MANGLAPSKQVALSSDQLMGAGSHRLGSQFISVLRPCFHLLALDVTCDARGR